MKKAAKVEAELEAKCHAYATQLSKEFFARMRQYYNDRLPPSERQAVYSAFYHKGRAPVRLRQGTFFDLL